MIKKVSYLHNLFDPELRKYTISWIIDRIKASNVEFDFIAVRGVSGLFAGVLVSEILEKPLVISRKQSSSHSSHLIEFILPEKTNYKYIIIDDLVFSGETLMSIKDQVNKYIKKSECVGVFIYSQNEIDYNTARWEINKIFENIHISIIEKNTVIDIVSTKEEKNV